MKSLDIIKNIIPMLSTIQAGGRFSNPLISLAQNWTMTLGSAAIEEGIDLSEALGKFSEIEAAEDFESQQVATEETLTVLENLLDDIPAGNVPDYVAAPEGFTTIRLRLSASISNAIDQYCMSPRTLEKMRRDAAQLAALAAAEEGVDDETLKATSIIYDLIDRSVDAEFYARRNLMSGANENMKKVAA